MELAWEHAVEDIPDAGLSQHRLATTDELDGLARALDLLSLAALDVEYTISRLGGRRYRLTGRLRAELSQTCVVTLEPVESTHEETFNAFFWPQEEIPAPHSGQIDIDDGDEPEPIVGEKIAVGRIVFECLAASVDPFPRKPGAVLDWQPPRAREATEGLPESPFAVLAKIRPKA